MGDACHCGCADPRGTGIHRMVALLAMDDVDAAIDAGLLMTDGCAGCSTGCTLALLAARDARRAALAARERFHAREARLLGRQRERAAKRGPSTGVAPSPTAPLPPAAAAALQRALDRVAGRGRT